MSRVVPVIPRFLEDVVARRLADEPVVVIHGARTVGKSTLLRRLAERLGTQVLDLDDLATRQAASADPAMFASGTPPVLIDEFQHVLDLLDAIKAELNRDLRPGRFVLTGSTRYLTLPQAAQSLTGRVHVLTLWPFSQGELEGRRETFLERLLSDPGSLVSGPASHTTRDDYVGRILGGGLPLAVARDAPGARDRWYDDYVTLVIERDVLDLRRVRQREVLPRLLRRIASQTAQPLNIAEAARHVGIAADLAEDYCRLLEAVFLVHRLPAWGRTLRSRASRLPKVHVVDPGLAGHLLGISGERARRKDPATLAELGHLAETFVVGEVLKQASWSDQRVEVGHYRTHDRYEVDLVVQTPDGRVAGVEVKFASRVTTDDLKGLRSLRTLLGPSFSGGVVLSTGPHAYRAEEGLAVLPLDRLWS